MLDVAAKLIATIKPLIMFFVVSFMIVCSLVKVIKNLFAILSQ